MKLSRRQLRKLINEVVMQEGVLDTFAKFLDTILPDDGGTMKGSLSNDKKENADNAVKKIKAKLKEKDLKVKSIGTGSKKGTGQRSGDKKFYYVKLEFDGDAGKVEKAIRSLGIHRRIKVHPGKYLFLDPK